MAYIGNTPTQQSFSPAVDYFSGNGSTVAFTLSRPVASVAQVQVTVNNVPQNPSTAFTVSSNTITFTGAPSSGTNNIYVQYTSPITQLIAPSQGTVGAAQLQDNAVTPAKMSRSGTSGQVLTSNGAGADPSYQALPAGGVTSAVAGNGVAVSAATGAVTFSLAVPTTGSVGSYVSAISIPTSGGGVYNFNMTFGSNYAAGSGGNQIQAGHYYKDNCGGIYSTATNALSGTWKWLGGTLNQNQTQSVHAMAIRVA